MFSFRVALRYLFSKKSHNAVNVISIISMLGVGIATAAIVCVLSVFNGFEDLATERMSRFDPPLKVVPEAGKVIGGADSLAMEIASLPGVAAAEPTIREQAVAMFAGAQMAIDIRGLPKGYDRIVDLSKLIIDGEYMTNEIEAPVATLSPGTAMRLGAFPGTDRLVGIYVPKRTGRINAANPMASFRTDSLFVGGVIQTEDQDIDTQSIFVPLEMARALLEYEGGEATAIEIAPRGDVAIEDVTAQIRAILPTGLALQDRFQQEAESFRMIKVEKWITFVMLAFILVIASFNIISTLSMLIIEKKSNMATMRALGASPTTIRCIFTWEGWLVTLTGGLIGIMFGTGLVLAQQFGGFIRLAADPSMLTVEAYPVRLNPVDLLIVIGLIAIIGLIVGYLTARFAHRR